MSALKRYFITGLLMWVPLGITIWVLSALIGAMDQTLLLLPISWRPESWLGINIPGVGVILTSHDAGDLEALCKRVIIINHGQIVYQDKVSTLKRRYLTTKTVSIRYAEQVPSDFGIAGTEVLKTSQYGVKLQFDSSATRVEDVIAQLAALLPGWFQPSAAVAACVKPPLFRNREVE